MFLGAELHEGPVVSWAQPSDLWFSCSAIGSHRTWKHMASIASSMGFKQSVCDQSFYVHHVSKFWAYLFAMSKVLELGESETSPCAMCSELLCLYR